MIAPLALAFFLGVLAAALVAFIFMPAPPGLLGTEKPDEIND